MGSCASTRLLGRPPAAVSRRLRAPAGRSGLSPSELLHRALTRLFVLAPANELGAVADAVARDVVKVDLDHEFGPQPLPHELLVGLPATRLAAAALAGAVRLEEADQLTLLLGGEARRVAHHVQLTGVVIGAEDERPERALLLAEAKRDHDQVSGADALDLRHPHAFTGLVRAVRVLGDDTLRHPRQPNAGGVAVVGRRRDLNGVADGVEQALTPLAVRQIH